MPQKLFLTSSVQAVAGDIASRLDLIKTNKLVFIDTAAEPFKDTDDIDWMYNDRQALVDAGFEVTDYTITSKNTEQLQTDLKDFDHIYLSGGDTVHLMEESLKSGFHSVVKDLVQSQGKTYISTSAGSVITAPNIHAYYFEEGNPEVNQGFGFVNFWIVPHWGSEDFKDRYLKHRMQIAYRQNEFPYILLADNQYLFVEGEDITLHTVR